MNLSPLVSQPACKYRYCERRNVFVLRSSIYIAEALKAASVLALLAFAIALRLLAISGTADTSPEQRWLNLTSWSTQLRPGEQLASAVGVGPSDHELRLRFVNAQNQPRRPRVTFRDHPASYPTEPHRPRSYEIASREDRAVALIVKRYRVDPALASTIVTSVYRNAEELNLNPMILFGIIRVESEFKPNAFYEGAQGLLQVIPYWHPKLIAEAQDRFGVSANLYDPEFNIWVASRIKKQYLTKYNGDMSKALLQYNGSLNDPEKTYYHKVLKAAQFFERELRYENF